MLSHVCVQANVHRMEVLVRLVSWGSNCPQVLSSVSGVDKTIVFV